MTGEPFKVEHLRAPSRQPVQDFRLSRPGIAIQNDKARRQGRRALIRRIEQIHHRPPESPVSTFKRLRPPADLAEDRRECARSHAPAPAIDKRAIAARPVEQVRLDIVPCAPRNQRSADLAGGERAHLLVERAHTRALLIVQHRQVDRAGNMVLGKLGGRAHVDDFIEGKRQKFAKGRQSKNHASAYCVRSVAQGGS